MKKKLVNNIKIAICDDDLCYYSKFEDFEAVYKKLDIPVNISLIPFAVSDHGDFHPYGCSGGKATSIEKNKELCEKLKIGIQQNCYEILLHGITHEYKKNGNKLIPEMMWKSEQECDLMIGTSIEMYAKLFGKKPNFFVAPSDKCQKFLFKLLRKYKLNYRGLIGKVNSRPFSFRTLFCFIKRMFIRIKYGYPYLGIMKYKGWNEIQSYQKLNFEYLKTIYLTNKKMGNPVIIETHYWHFKKHSEDYQSLVDFINFAKNDGAKFCLMSDIIH